MMKVTEELNNILLAAYAEAQSREHEYLTPEHILFASLFFEEAKEIIRRCGGSVDDLKKKIEAFFQSKIPARVVNKEPIHSLSFQNVMNRAVYHTVSAQKAQLDIGDVLIAIFDEKESHASFILQGEGLTRLNLLNYISHGISVIPEERPTGQEGREGEKKTAAKENKALALFTTELVAKARAGELEPLIGREDILERTVQVLCRRNKNNPIHVGEAGVGKTAITEGLAQLIADNKVPKPLQGAAIYSLDMGAVVSGTRYRGDFEERMTQVVDELKKKQNAILFIDEIHTTVGAGAVSGGSLDAANILKPALTSGKLRCIGSTTHEEYRKAFEKDRALSRRFQPIEIPEPTVAETVQILQGLREKYESFHHVVYSDDALRAAAELAAKHINDRHLPDKAIDVMDEAGARMAIAQDENPETPTITPGEIEYVVAKMARIPEKSVSSSEAIRLQDLETTLKTWIFGQNEAIQAVVQAIRRARAGFRDANKPVASLLFAGPTGVGKTELARQLAQTMGIPLNRYDMSEYQEKHTVSRLVGAPPGYVGYEEGGLLTETIRKAPHCVLLLDEIEKAHPDVFNTLLQVMDYATLTDNTGRKADFRNVIIIMTSNAGAREVGKTKIGFGERQITSGAIDDALKKIFTPEFRNRLDGMITFNDLDEQVIVSIVKKQIREFHLQLEEKNILLAVQEEVYAWIAEHGYSREFGAREIGRLIQDKIKNFFVNEVLFGRLVKGGRVSVAVADDAVVLAVLESAV
jgi:ATP-dependent Clp protease ATP-binding subunit ClpA